jgi:hypothetical protein
MSREIQATVICGCMWRLSILNAHSFVVALSQQLFPLSHGPISSSQGCRELEIPPTSSYPTKSPVCGQLILFWCEVLGFLVLVAIIGWNLAADTNSGKVDAGGSSSQTDIHVFIKSPSAVVRGVNYWFVGLIEPMLVAARSKAWACGSR